MYHNPKLYIAKTKLGYSSYIQEFQNLGQLVVYPKLCPQFQISQSCEAVSNK